jgi:hypothetical protein
MQRTNLSLLHNPDIHSSIKFMIFRSLYYEGTENQTPEEQTQWDVI